MAEKLLIIEDETLLGNELRRHYRASGWDVGWVKTIDEARGTLSKQNLEPLVVLSDMNLPDGSGLDLLEETRRRGQPSEWIFLTGYGTVPDSVRALRLGAFEFLTKPCEQDRLDLAVNSAARSARSQRRLHNETLKNSQRYSPEVFAGRSSAAKSVRDMLVRLGDVPFSTLIITGETGTGKGLVARILHHAGQRASGPLVEINCAALPRELIESELFGHEPGAFTGAKHRRVGLIEQASGGTLFLDEIGELELDLQAKLLKAIEDRSIRRLGGNEEIGVDVQVLAATNQDLDAKIRDGEFRSDLFHRISVFRLELPPLRKRKEDFEDLVPMFVAEYNAKAGKKVSVLPDDLWPQLRAHDWPGNVRELRNVIERCVLFAADKRFPLEWLQLRGAESSAPAHPEVSGDQICMPLDGTMVLEDMERHIIKSALERNGNNVTATARALGTTRETLRYRINKYGLERNMSRESD